MPFELPIHWHAVIRRNSLKSVPPLIQSPSIFGETIVEYFPTRAGELLSVLAIEHHILTLIGGGGTHYRARYFAAEDWSAVAPLRPADILVVIHPNPLEKSAVVTHATTGDRDGDQYNLV